MTLREFEVIIVSLTRIINLKTNGLYLVILVVNYRPFKLCMFFTISSIYFFQKAIKDFQNFLYYESLQIFEICSCICKTWNYIGLCFFMQVYAILC